ncbi:MAG TPA: hypothetical protein VM755_16485 [Stellaceae bacterium]|nr:hypothetical protein [Stellaceae bacterium]
MSDDESRVAGSNVAALVALLEALARRRARWHYLFAWLAAWCERRLAARLTRGWPGGYFLHKTGDLVFVPAPLDAAGRAALLGPPRAHPAAIGTLRPGAVAIEIDAGLGGWTLPLARAVGAAGRVLATEPRPELAEALAKTLAANALRQAEIVRCAIGREDVPAGALRSLDSLVAEHRLLRLDLLRIAAAGDGRAAVEGARDSLDRFRPVVVLRVGDEPESDRPAIHYHLRGTGYRMIGILLEHGMAEAHWPQYVAREPPFEAGEAREVLLVPEEEPH